MKEYTINFHITYNIEAKDEETALEKATEEFKTELEKQELSVDDFCVDVNGDVF